MLHTFRTSEFVDLVFQHRLLPYLYRWDEYQLGRKLEPEEFRAAVAHQARTLLRWQARQAGAYATFPEPVARPPHNRASGWRTVPDDVRRQLEQEENTPMSTLTEKMTREAGIVLAADPAAGGDDLLPALNKARDEAGATPYETPKSAAEPLAMARARLGIKRPSRGPITVDRVRYLKGCAELGVEPSEVDPTEDDFTWVNLPDPKEAAPVVKPPVAPVATPAPVVVAATPPSAVDVAYEAFRDALAREGWTVVRCDLERVERKSLAG